MRSFAAATCSVATGRSANVPKPQSGFSQMRSLPSNSASPVTRAAIAPGSSVGWVRGLTAPKPTLQRPGSAASSDSGPARGVAY